MRGRGRHKPGEMNGTERKMAEHLEGMKHRGEIIDYRFESMTLKLAKDTRYTPDFMVMMPDGEIQFWEVKGFWHDDARVKIKVAAEHFPFTFKAFSPKPKRDGGGWKIEEFGGDVE
jgi:hypothetical protein